MSIKRNTLNFFSCSGIKKEVVKEDSEEKLRKTLESSNQFLLNQIEKNKKYIKSLQNFQAWLSSCPERINPELTSLILSNQISQQDYEFELKLVNEISKFICKSKYFCLVVELVPLTGKVLLTSDIVPVEVKLYTSEEVPKQITHTMQGKQIIREKGNNMIGYHGGESKFLVRIKMQITEVSSHFINGTINLVICMKDSVPIIVKPLIIKDIIVKAKEKTCARWRQL